MSKPATSTLYRPRQPRALPLYQVIERFLPQFEQAYGDRYAARYGPWRPVIGDAARAFLRCSDLHWPQTADLRLVCTGSHAPDPISAASSNGMTNDDARKNGEWPMTSVTSASLSPDPLSRSRPYLSWNSHATVLDVANEVPLAKPRLPKRAIRPPFKNHACKGVALQLPTARD